jgi:Leucine-rich repeat (LRR) protein
MKTPSRSFLKTVVVLIALLSFTSMTIKAQHSIAISDTSFARILRETFPACMNGDQMDTTCPGIRNATYLDLGWTYIEDLTGLQYFTGLTKLSIHSSVKPIKFMPPLSFPELTNFDCSYNNMTTLPALTFPKLKIFYCWSNFNDKLKTLPDLNFPLLESFVCTNNFLTTLTNLTAPNLKSFYCSGNKLTEISLNYPKLVNLNCPFNQLTFLPPLPSTLCSLDCSGNNLTTLPALPDSLCGLYCDSNKITCFPVFPLKLAQLNIVKNPFKCLPNHITSMSALLQSFPICKDGDVVNNPYLFTCARYYRYCF